MKNVRCAKCTKCGREYEAASRHYHLQPAAAFWTLSTTMTTSNPSFPPESLARCGDYCMWRYRPFLPVEAGFAPHAPAGGLVPPLPGGRPGAGARPSHLYIKDDGQNPTASLKDRASAMAVVKAREAGADTIACSSTGNAASSLAGNAAAAGFKTTHIFCPHRAPKGRWPSS